ncbi:outer membrane beta-barrel protein [Sphingobium yanoikuyae]|jgi:hypothetical protein|uniref:outer membrane beta-barrel protein n=1 Tax=Sphingobium yanoikuyae TaxID=13690 RepID=UPI0028A078B4|nr:outer membrane beta-barrel protein [Sphingobium yanoikuyae]
MTRLHYARLPLACSIVLGCPAFAQVEVPPDGLTVAPTVRMLYDDNVLRQSDDLVSGDKDDLRITPALDVTFRKNLGVHQVTVVGSLGYDFHQRYSNLDRERVTLTAKGDVKVSALCYLRPSARLNFAQADLADQGMIVGNSERTQDYAVTAECDKPYGYYPVIKLGYLQTNNSVDSRRPFDIRTRSAGIGIAYSKASLGDIRLMFNVEAFRRPHWSDETSELRMSRGADNYRVGIEFKRAVAPRLSWSAGIGYIHTKARDERVDDYSGLGYHAGAVYRPSPRTSLVFDGSRSTSNQSNTGATYIVLTNFSLRGNATLSSRSSIQAGASYARRQFKGELLIDTDMMRGTDETTALNAGYRFALRSRLTAGVDVRHEWRESAVERYRYKSTSMMLSLGLTL